MNNTVEKWLFGFPKVKWLQYTGEVGKGTSHRPLKMVQAIDVKISQDLTPQKSLKSVNFWQSYLKNKKVDFLGHSVYIVPPLTAISAADLASVTSVKQDASASATTTALWCERLCCNWWEQAVLYVHLTGVLRAADKLRQQMFTAYSRKHCRVCQNNEVKRSSHYYPSKK